MIDTLLESPLEEIFYDIMTDYELSSMFREVKPQHKVGRYRIDFALFNYDLKIAVEIQSMKWHATPQQMAKDAKKKEFLEEHDWKVLYFWPWDLLSDPRQVVSDIEACL